MKLINDKAPKFLNKILSISLIFNVILIIFYFFQVIFKEAELSSKTTQKKKIQYAKKIEYHQLTIIEPFLIKIKTNNEQGISYNQLQNLIENNNNNNNNNHIINEKRLSQFLVAIYLLGLNDLIKTDQVQFYPNSINNMYEPKIKLTDIKKCKKAFQNEIIPSIFEIKKWKSENLIQQFIYYLNKYYLDFNVNSITENIHHNTKLVRYFLNSKKFINSYLTNFSQEKNVVSLGIQQLTLAPITIYGLFLQGKKISTNQPLFINQENPYQLKNIHFKLKPGLIVPDLSKVKLQYAHAGIYDYFESDFYPYPYKNEKILNDDIRVTSNIIENRKLFQEYFVFEKNISNNQIKLIKDYTIINKPIFLPAGYTLKLTKDQTIDFQKNAYLISESPLEFIGQKNHPVSITSNDQTGQGILVIGSNDKIFQSKSFVSKFEHVNISNLTNIKNKILGITGAITFYEGEVQMNYLQSHANNSEDSINFFKVKFSLNNSLIENTTSDALDGDFTEGIIENTIFRKLGNDAIDFSGSKIIINKIVVESASDKGVSVGENSTLTGNHIQIFGSEIGIVSKDLSVTNVSEVKFVNVKLGFAVYQKKPEFGPAKLSVKNLQTSQLTKLHLTQKESQIMIEGEVQVDEVLDVESLLYGNIFGKMSVR